MRVCHTSPCWQHNQKPALCSYCCYIGADGGQPLVKSGGTVQYKVTIVTGNRTIPAGNHLSITTGTGVVVSPCQAGDVDVSIGGVAIPADIPPQTAITCTIEVAVDNTHKAAGEVAPFILTAALGGPNITSAFFIPRITTPSVAVYTGGELSTLDSQVVLADGSYYQGGFCWQLALQGLVGQICCTQWCLLAAHRFYGTAVGC